MPQGQTDSLPRKIKAPFHKSCSGVFLFSCNYTVLANGTMLQLVFRRGAYFCSTNKITINLFINTIFCNEGLYEAMQNNGMMNYSLLLFERRLSGWCKFAQVKDLMLKHICLRNCTLQCGFCVTYVTSRYRNEILWWSRLWLSVFHSTPI